VSPGILRHGLPVRQLGLVVAILVAKHAGVGAVFFRQTAFFDITEEMQIMEQRA